MLVVLPRFGVEELSALAQQRVYKWKAAGENGVHCKLLVKIQEVP